MKYTERIVLVFAIMLTSVAMGANVLWTNANGNNRWSDALNWRDGAKPTADDVVYTSNTVAGATIWVDEPVTIKSLRFEGTQRLTLHGEKITVSAGYSLTQTERGKTGTNQADYHAAVAGVLGYVSAATISNAVEFTHANNSGIINARHDLLFYGPVTVSSTSTFMLHTGLTDDTDGYADASPSIHFYGGFEAANATVQSILCPVYEIWFHGKVVMKKLKGSDWSNVRYVLATDDVTLSDGAVDVCWHCYVAAASTNAFPSNAIFAPTYNSDAKAKIKVSSSSFNLCGYDQTIDCVKGAAAFANTTYSYGAIRSVTGIEAGDAVPATLTLRGTQDAVASMAVVDAVSLVWDPVGSFTQVFSNRINTTTGSITVKGGTFQVKGAGTFANAKKIAVAANALFDLDTTAAGALANLQNLDIAANGLVRIASTAATPFSGGRCLAKIANGGKIKVEGDQTVTVAGVVYNGIRLADNTYDKSTANWIDGEGSVKVDSTVVTEKRWAQVASGDWNVANNWLGRTVPTSADASAVIDVDTAADMSVTFKNGDQLPQSIVLANGTAKSTLSIVGSFVHVGGSLTCQRGGVFSVGENGYYGHTGDGAFDVGAGGAFRVDGGIAAITNGGTFAVSGTLASTGKVVVASGNLVYAPTASAATMTVSEGGLVELTGGSFATLKAGSASSYNPLMLAGGAFKASGTAVYDNLGTYVKNYTKPFSMGYGEIVFSDNAVWKSVAQPDSATKLYFSPSAGRKLDVRFENSACLTNTTTMFLLGTAANAKATVEFASSANHGVPWLGNNREGGIAKCGFIGCDNGHGEMIVSSGNAGFGVQGTTVGGSSSMDTSTGANGILRVKGGWFRTCGSKYHGWDRRRVLGLSVGYGAWTTVTSGRPYVGLVEVTGGVVSNEFGYTVIGVGYGKGTWLQKGGVSRIGTEEKNDSHSAIGSAGGIGRMEVSGGTVETTGSVYLGGTRPTMYLNNTNDSGERGFFEANGWPADRHDAEGTLVVSGGSFNMLKAGRTCMLGMDGTGAIEVIGSAGTIQLQGLVLSNTVVAATQGVSGYTTASQLSFKLDAEGVSPIRVNGTVVNTPGTQVTVDVGNVSGLKGKIRLIESTSWQGPALEDATIVGAAAKDVRFATDANGPYIKFKQGAVLLIY